MALIGSFTKQPGEALPVDIDYATFVRVMTSVLPGLNEEFMVYYIRRLALEALNLPEIQLLIASDAGEVRRVSCAIGQLQAQRLMV